MLPSAIEIRHAYRALMALIRTRPMFLIGYAIALLLTDMLATAIGLTEARRLTDVPLAGMIFFTLSKLLVILAAYIGLVRLAGDTALPARTILAIDRRQARWLGLILLFMIAMLAGMIGLKIAIGALFAILGGSKAAASTATLIAYVAIELILMARILPGVAGVMIGDRSAGIGWSWARTRGRISATVLIVVALMLPFELLHIALTIAMRRPGAGPDLPLMLLDGFAMALVIAGVAAAHRQLYAHAAARPPGEG